MTPGLTDETFLRPRVLQERAHMQPRLIEGPFCEVNFSPGGTPILGHIRDVRTEWVSFPG